ncbi:MAG TPA: hypothetical protein VGT08_07300 [Terracidiphilus sp.]|nr:hypothetical protein [Terracidiphilus sp.]
MEITLRSLLTLVHGMGFGALYLLACSGAIVELYRRYSPTAQAPVSSRDEAFLRIYLVVMATLAWLTVLTGAYIIYPWYRAAAPPGTASLATFPQRLLMSSPTTIAWHSIGMEWKEHVAWLAPISITMAAAVFVKYGRNLRHHPQLRSAVLCFVLISFLAAGIAGFFGAMLDKYAPVGGGQTIQLIHGE